MSVSRKLTPLQAARMFTDIANGMPKLHVGKKYGISARSVHRYIERGREHDTKMGPKPKSGPKLKPCGTQAAYQRHIRNKELACDKCLKANALYERKRVKTSAA